MKSYLLKRGQLVALKKLEAGKRYGCQTFAASMISAMVVQIDQIFRGLDEDANPFCEFTIVDYNDFAYTPEMVAAIIANPDGTPYQQDFDPYVQWAEKAGCSPAFRIGDVVMYDEDQFAHVTGYDLCSGLFTLSSGQGRTAEELAPVNNGITLDCTPIKPIAGQLAFRWRRLTIDITVLNLFIKNARHFGGEEVFLTEEYKVEVSRLVMIKNYLKYLHGKYCR